MNPHLRCPNCGHYFDPTRAHRRHLLNFDHLAEVADVYRRNQHTGKPMVAVQLNWETSYRSAARWVQLARQEGLLP